MRETGSGSFGPNKAPTANPAVSFLLHARCQWRGVAEVRRSAISQSNN
jgi:hypothetical protein